MDVLLLKLEMTLEEYEKVMEEKRKALLQNLKVEERKVIVDKEFETMQQLSGKKSNNDAYAKLGSDKDKKKEIADKDERAKKLQVSQLHPLWKQRPEPYASV